MKGAFIVFEGVDGSGKSTVCRRVASQLESEGRGVILTAEPTHEGIGAFIRSGSAGDISQSTEALLFVADRNDHTERMARWVSEGAIVLCDRYFASTVAYQSAKLDGDGTDRDWLLSINSRFTSGPDATILLDIDPSESLRRVGVRGEEVSKFERLDFLEQVRSNYLRLAEEYGFSVVDASEDPDTVFDRVMSVIREVI
ncbi:MAG: dTMP kinase [Candidatus Methanomethylophilaceae archaeon]